MQYEMHFKVSTSKHRRISTVFLRWEFWHVLCNKQDHDVVVRTFEGPRSQFRDYPDRRLWQLSSVRPSRRRNKVLKQMKTASFCPLSNSSTVTRHPSPYQRLLQTDLTHPQPLIASRAVTHALNLADADIRQCPTKAVFCKCNYGL